MTKIMWEDKEDDGYPGIFTDYAFWNGWLILNKLFPSVPSIFAIGGCLPGMKTYWHNFRFIDVGLASADHIFIRIDFGRWFITFSRPNHQYRSAQAVGITGKKMEVLF